MVRSTSREQQARRAGQQLNGKKGDGSGLRIKGDWRFCCERASSSLVRLRGAWRNQAGPGALGKKSQASGQWLWPGGTGGVLCAGAKQAAHIRLGLLSIVTIKR
jgi:hypothetical protein